MRIPKQPILYSLLTLLLSTKTSTTMKFYATVVPAILVSLATASPIGNIIDLISPCLTSTSIKQAATDYSSLIGAYTDKLAGKVLHPEFTHTSDSINILSGRPLGSVTFASKQAFMSEQAHSSSIPLAVTSIEAYTCNTLVMKWTQTFGQSPQTVTGLAVLDLKKDKDGWKFYRLKVEFNSLTYLTNIGGTVTMPGQ